MPNQKIIKFITSFVFFILNIIIVFVVVLQYDIEFGIRINALLLLTFLFYYILGIYDFTNYKFRIQFILLSLTINFGAFFISYFSKLHKSDKIMYILLFSFLFQILYKFVIAKTIFKKKNIIIIGINNKITVVEDIIKRQNNIYNFKGIVLFNQQEVQDDMYNIIGSIEEVRDIVKKHNVNEIVNLTDNKIRSNKFERLLQLKLWGVRFYNFISFCEDAENKIPIDHILEKELLGGNGFRLINNRSTKKIKRLFDLSLAIIIGIISFPIILISAIVIKLESKGPIFYIQERIGLGGEIFKIFKLRTMRVHDVSKHSQYAEKKDARITLVGRFLRITRIDEIPQMINILQNDMSFIGPRAEWNILANQYSDQISFYNLRHIIKPGITGWAQVNYPYGVSVNDAKKKLEYDLYYIKHQSLILELRIILRTFKVVLLGKGQ